MGKLPYFPCYARDVISSSKIATMSGDAFKAYWLLLCASWLEDERATLPNNEANLEALARVDAPTWLRIKDEVLACFETNGNGRLFSPRLLEVSFMQEKRASAGRKGGVKTQSGPEATYEANFKQTTKPHSQSHRSESEEDLREEKNPPIVPPRGRAINRILTDNIENGDWYETSKGRLTGSRLLEFREFCVAFGMMSDTRSGAESWRNIKDYSDELVSEIIKGAARACASRPAILSNGGIPKMMQGWLNKRRWEDEVTKNAWDQAIENVQSRHVD